jgi:uncharacterized DUF497 family protein
MHQVEKRVTWDLAKDQANKKKHKISFEEAATVFYDLLSLTVDDQEHSAYERRCHIIGESDKGRLVVVTFFEGPGEIRIISAQKPTRQERKNYEEISG